MHHSDIEMQPNLFLSTSTTPKVAEVEVIKETLPPPVAMSFFPADLAVKFSLSEAVSLAMFNAGFNTTQKILDGNLTKVKGIGPKAEKKIKAEIRIEMDLVKKVLGEIRQIWGNFKEVDVRVIEEPKISLNRIDIQPLFVRYKPSAKNACFRGSTTATTGGSFTSLRDRAIEMWDRCCISLNFLPIIYINNSDYRVLEKSEEKSLIAEYNDPDAIEVFFVEVSDPVGLYGGGKCLSAGTANAQIIAYDTNLPINLYNLAHEIGHAFGLKHPRRLIRNNSTANSLMEPSGFCADNPALMSDENCDNISNPLIYHFFSDSPYVICIRKTNM